jgi:hypothetical protein
VAVVVSNVDLMERVCHLTNKIYWEMLFITRHEKMTYITMGEFDHLVGRVSVFSLDSAVHDCTFFKLGLARLDTGGG